ncbi:MAG: nuclear transport factor 2 family protein [Rhodococcus sp. (in: high G+C Gram-positive bacteria)]|nr:nuclear transport factor 2 family protein [Rhodococcus sp. (in: high G+C Gram-positive bacteria)]
MNSTADELVATYLDALHRGDLGAILGLFAPGAVVHSPLYGPMPAPEFYRALFADTASSELTSKGVAEGRTSGGALLITFWFHFDWRLPSGEAAPFDVVDVAELDEHGLVTSLSIVYDTVDVRPTFERETGSSWRSAEHVEP